MESLRPNVTPLRSGARAATHLRLDLIPERIFHDLVAGDTQLIQLSVAEIVQAHRFAGGGYAITKVANVARQQAKRRSNVCEKCPDRCLGGLLCCRTQSEISLRNGETSSLDQKMWVHRPPHNRRSRIAVMRCKKMCR